MKKMYHEIQAGDEGIRERYVSDGQNVDRGFYESARIPNAYDINAVKKSAYGLLMSFVAFNNVVVVVI